MASCCDTHTHTHHSHSKCHLIVYELLSLFVGVCVRVRVCGCAIVWVKYKSACVLGYEFFCCQHHAVDRPETEVGVLVACDCWRLAQIDFSAGIACLFCRQGLLRCLVLTAYFFLFSCLSKIKIIKSTQIRRGVCCS